MSHHYKVIYSGFLKDGTDAEQFVQNFVQIFNVPEANARKLVYAGRAIVLKENLDQATAEKYRHAMDKLGMQVHVEEIATDPQVDCISPAATVQQPATTQGVDSNVVGKDVHPTNTQDHAKHVKEHLVKFSKSSAQFMKERVLPEAGRIAAGVYTTARQRVLPTMASGSVAMKNEIVRIHRSQNWLQRCSTTLGSNAVGLGLAILSTKVVESLVETPKVSNLWGFLANRPVVSQSTFELLSFLAEYFIALIVFTVTDYYISSYRQRQEAQVEPE